MTRTESPNFKDDVDTCQSVIHGIHGTLFLLSIVTDEDDAATLRADLKRSRLSEYKLQRCSSLDDACNMLRACGFDLLFLNLEELDDPAQAIDRLRDTGFENPILGLASRRSMDKPDCARPAGIDDVICKEDLSPSLVEHAVRSTIVRHTLSSERALLETRLNLALETGKMGSWIYHPKERRFEWDEIAQAMIPFPENSATRSMEEFIEQVYPEDRSKVSDALDQLPLKDEIVGCQFRVNSDQMPLPSLELRGRIWQGGAYEEPAIMGVLRQTPRTNELFERINEANTAIQEAFLAREEAMRKANQKLQALASELQHTEGRASKEPEPPKTEAPSFSESKQEPAKPAAVHKIVSSKSRKAAKAVPKPEPKAQDEALGIDKKVAYQEVLKSVARKKAATPKQESLPFDFAQEPEIDYIPPNPSKEGFVGAAKRLVTMTRKEHKLEASISVADQQSIELELEKDLLFHILRELITNVVKHSRARLCIITLFRDEDEWVLQVEDDGVGLNEKLKSVNAPLNKIGLFQIRTQLALKGGHLDMVPASPNGLIARVRIPVSIRDNAKTT